MVGPKVYSPPAKGKEPESIAFMLTINNKYIQPRPPTYTQERDLAWIQLLLAMRTSQAVSSAGMRRWQWQ